MLFHTVLISLDDRDALDPLRAGAKAARLARARRAGISVLPGVVIEVASSLPFLAEAARVAELRGPAAGQLALLESTLPAGLADAVVLAIGCERLVVRSSSPVEESGEWSGAFASYTDVGRDELATAIRGCWSSVLGRDARGRFEQAGRDPLATGMAVLVQPAITPSPGGVAHVDHDTVCITVADDGKLSALLQGWGTGQRAELPRSGSPTGPAVETHGLPLLRRVADLARTCRSRTGATQLEWAFAGEDCYLLQARLAEPRRSRAGGSRAPVTLAGDQLIQVARTAARFGGASGDELMLPWCFAPGGVGSQPDSTCENPESLPPSNGLPTAAELRRAARALAGQAWRTSEDQAVELAQSVLARVRETLDAAATADLQALGEVDAVQGSRIVTAVERAAAHAVAAGKLFDVADAWRLTPAQLDQLLAGTLDLAAAAPAATAWEPFLAEAARARGRLTAGEPAAAGLGAGRLLVLSAPRRLAGVRERWVLQVPEPLPAYSPLLWGAAGLVSVTGSASAHLFDVARTLGVPAVAGADLPAVRARAPVVAVDGTAGEVFVL